MLVTNSFWAIFMSRSVLCLEKSIITMPKTMAIIAKTTINSIKVNPKFLMLDCWLLVFNILFYTTVKTYYGLRGFFAEIFVIYVNFVILVISIIPLTPQKRQIPADDFFAV